MIEDAWGKKNSWVSYEEGLSWVARVAIPFPVSRFPFPALGLETWDLDFDLDLDWVLEPMGTDCGRQRSGRVLFTLHDNGTPAKQFAQALHYLVVRIHDECATEKACGLRRIFRNQIQV